VLKLPSVKPNFVCYFFFKHKLENVTDTMTGPVKSSNWTALTKGLDVEISKVRK